MIINYDLSRSNLSDIRRNNTEFFNKRLTTILTNIYPTILFQIEKNKLLIKDVPLIYIDSIKNTLDEIFKNPSNLFEKNNSLFTNEDSLINLMFKSFSLENKNINLFLDNILNIKIEYKEDLFFYSSSFLKEPNNLNSRIKLLYQDNHRYFYKINYNSNIHTKSSLELFNGLLNSNNPIQVINNPSSLFQFEFKLDNDIHLLSKVINVYSKKNIHECDTYKLSPTDIAKYEKNFKYITFLKDRTPIIEKRNVIKAIQNNITSGDITSGDITSGEITSGEITSGEITSGEIISDEIKRKLLIKYNKIELMLSNFNIVEKNQSVSSQEEPVTQSNSITDIDKIKIQDYYELELKGDNDTKIDVSKKKYLKEVTKKLKKIQELKTKLDKEKKQLNSKSKGSHSESNKKVTQELETKNIDNNERIRRAEYLKIKATNLKEDIKLKAIIKKAELKKKELEDNLKSAQNVDQGKLQELADEKAKISLLKMQEPPKIKKQTGGSSEKLEKIIYNSSNSVPELTYPIFAYNGFDSSNTNTHYMALCIKYPKTLFIFNDGLTSVTGKGGTASIRDMPNAIGIPMGAYKSDWSESYSKIPSNHTSINAATIIKQYKVYDKKNNIIVYNEPDMTFDKVLDLAIKYIKQKFKNDDYNSIIYSSESITNSNIGLGLFSTETSQDIVTLASNKLKNITKREVEQVNYQQLIKKLDELNLELCDDKLAPIIYSDNYSLTSDLNKNIFILRDSMILNFGTKKYNEYLIIPYSAVEEIKKDTLAFEVAKNIIKEPISGNNILFPELHLIYKTIQIKTKADYLKSEKFDYRLNVDNICFVNVQSINEKLTDESKIMSTDEFKQSYENELKILYGDIITEVKAHNTNLDELNVCFPIIMGGNIHKKFDIEASGIEGYNNEYITKISDFLDSTLNSLYNCFFDSGGQSSELKINIYLSAYKDFDYKQIIHNLKTELLEDDETLIYTEIPKEIPDPSRYYTSVPVYVPSKQTLANSYPNISIGELFKFDISNKPNWPNQGVVPFYYNDDDSGSFNVNGRIYDNMYQSGIFGNFYGHRFHRIKNFKVNIDVNIKGHNSEKGFTNSESAFHASKFTTSISTNQMMPTNQSGNCIYCKTRPKYTKSFFCGTGHMNADLNCAYCRTRPKTGGRIYCDDTQCNINGEKIRTQGNKASKGGGNKKDKIPRSKYIQKGGDNMCEYCHVKPKFNQKDNKGHLFIYCGKGCLHKAKTRSSRPVKSTVNLDSFTGISGEQAFQLKRRLQQDRNYGFQKSLNNNTNIKTHREDVEKSLNIWSKEDFSNVPNILFQLYQNEMDLQSNRVFNSILAMYIILYKKFSNPNNMSHYLNCDLKTHLLRTGNLILIEHNALQSLNSDGTLNGNPLDNTWSDCKNGDGLNLLGELIMILREQLRAPNKSAFNSLNNTRDVFRKDPSLLEFFNSRENGKNKTLPYDESSNTFGINKKIRIKLYEYFKRNIRLYD